MKIKITVNAILVSLISCIPSFGQNTVPASEIMEKAKKGENISYENITVRGDLDFTLYFEKRNEEKFSKKRSRWSDSENTIQELIQGKVEFENCTFEDGVLAYINDERTDFTFTASFRNDVVFKNCTFLKESAFKYSRFDRTTDFSGSEFNDEALFKYSKFEEYANFNGARFRDDANFKYANFDDGLDFSNTIFQNDLNLKYAKIEGDFNSENMDIQDDLDVKYTEINGQSFSKYLLKSR